MGKPAAHHGGQSIGVAKMSKEENQAAKAPGATGKGFVPKVKRNITLPLLKAAIDKPIYFKFTEEMKIGKPTGDKDAAIVGTGVNLETGEECQILVSAVVQSILHEEFGAPKFGVPKKGDPVQVLEPADKENPNTYVGCGFAITKHAKASGKQYHPYTVQELEV